MNAVNCTGWWEQRGHGHQEMHELVLDIDSRNGLIEGSGNDIIGPFTLFGVITDRGVVEMWKNYRRHRILYRGQYDGEGQMTGKWHYHCTDSGPWAIALTRAVQPATDADIRQISGK